MPNSLRARLKKLVHKGELSEKDLERIIIRPANNKSSNDDYISRQEAIDLFKNDEDADYCKWSTKGIISELEDLPSADFASRWISVDDGLPKEKEKMYLVTLDPSLCVGYPQVVFDTFGYDGQWRRYENSVIAWMELPDAYKDPRKEYLDTILGKDNCLIYEAIDRKYHEKYHEENENEKEEATIKETEEIDNVPYDFIKIVSFNGNEHYLNINTIIDITPIYNSEYAKSRIIHFTGKYIESQTTVGELFNTINAKKTFKYLSERSQFFKTQV